MMLKSALEGELKASAFYWKVANEAAAYEVKDTFVEAWRDEKKHVEMITVLLRQMTGTEPSRPNVKVPSYSNLKEAIQKALEGERNDYVFYGNIINTSPYDFVDQAFREIRRDEQVHAQKFQSLLIEMKN